MIRALILILIALQIFFIWTLDQMLINLGQAQGAIVELRQEDKKIRADLERLTHPATINRRTFDFYLGQGEFKP